MKRLCSAGNSSSSAIEENLKVPFSEWRRIKFSITPDSLIAQRLAMSIESLEGEAGACFVL